MFFKNNHNNNENTVVFHPPALFQNWTGHITDTNSSIRGNQALLFYNPGFIILATPPTARNATTAPRVLRETVATCKPLLSSQVHKNVSMRRIKRLNNSWIKQYRWLNFYFINFTNLCKCLYIKLPVRVPRTDIFYFLFSYIIAFVGVFYVKHLVQN